MKSILNTENNREKCQKFTPLNIVDDMLDMAEYTTNLMGKKVLENSFQFVFRIFRLYKCECCSITDYVWVKK